MVQSKRRVSTRAKLIAALIVVAVVIAVLIQTAVTKAATYYITVSQLYQEGTSSIGEQTAVSGMIVGSSVQWNAAGNILAFEVRDSDNAGSRTLPVIYHGDKPDNFTNDWPVIVFGSLNQNGTFEANKLLVKCPSKYSTGTPQAQ